MNNTISKILKLSEDLTTQELMALYQSIVSLIKMRQETDFKMAAIGFSKGDIVSFVDPSGTQINGVIIKKNTKTLQIITLDNYYINIPATYLKLEENPSKRLKDFRKKLIPSYEEMFEKLKFAIEKNGLKLDEFQRKKMT